MLSWILAALTALFGAFPAFSGVSFAAGNHAEASAPAKQADPVALAGPAASDDLATAPLFSWSESAVPAGRTGHTLAPQEETSWSGSFGAQLGRKSVTAQQVYAALLSLPPAEFDALPGTEPPDADTNPHWDAVTRTAPIPAGSRLTYRRLYLGAADSVTPSDKAELSRLLESHIQAALEAFGRDHADIFWLSFGDGGTTYNYTYRTQLENGNTVVFEITSVQFYLRVLPAYRGQVGAVAANLAAQVAAIIAPALQVPDRYYQVKYFHDEVIKLVKRNLNYMGATVDEAVGPLLNHTGSPLGCAKAYQLLCVAAGIPTVIISGQKDNNGLMQHIWNETQMEDGLWYGVDTVLDNGYNPSVDAIYDEYLLAGSQTVDYLFEQKPFSLSHLSNGYFTNDNHFLFAYPPLAAEKFGLNLAPLINALLLKPALPDEFYVPESLQAFRLAWQAGRLLFEEVTGPQDQPLVDAAAAAIVSAYEALQPIPLLQAAPGSAAIIDHTRRLITSFREGVRYADLGNWILPRTGLAYTVTPAMPQTAPDEESGEEVSVGTGAVGTGTTLAVTFDTEDGPVDVTYTVLLFGDLSGDGYVNSMDVFLLDLALASGLPLETALGALPAMAADCNHDGMVDSADRTLMLFSTVKLATIDQTA
jgi:hypothetical protein